MKKYKILISYNSIENIENILVKVLLKELQIIENNNYLEDSIELFK